MVLVANGSDFDIDEVLRGETIKQNPFAFNAPPSDSQLIPIKEEIDKLLKEKNNLMEERIDVSETTPEEMWKRELSAFKMVYKKLF